MESTTHRSFTSANVANHLHATRIGAPSNTFSPCDVNGAPIPPRKRVTEIPTQLSSSGNSFHAIKENMPTSSGPILGEVQPAKKPKVTYPVPNQCMESGHFYVVLGEDVDTSTGRYKILSMLGQGTFGKVVEAWDRTLKVYCAVKIVRNTPKYTRDAQIEVKYMERVCQRDPRGEFAIVRVQRNFINDQGHMCIVMPKHGRCLLDYIQKHGPLSLPQVAQVAYQLCRTLDFLHTQNRYIHTDLKPENILLNANSNINPMQIRVCDLGGCSDERHSALSIVSTRHYRAPEVILGTGWKCSADMWSVGCILYELYTGKMLYDTHENREHLAKMQQHQGTFPPDMLTKIDPDMSNWFHRSGKLVWPASGVSRRSIESVEAEVPLRSRFSDMPEFLDLLERLLMYQPSKRLSAKDAMEHPFITKYLDEKHRVGRE
eukprot:PhM_4_TR14858/c0_g2_i1/m.26167/K08287/E2.7.12.1; dual-specificity kinase